MIFRSTHTDQAASSSGLPHDHLQVQQELKPADSSSQLDPKQHLEEIPNDPREQQVLARGLAAPR